MRRQLATAASPKRARHEDRDAARQRRTARRRVGRRERLIGDEHVRVGERVHERGLAGVRVADERGEEQAFARARAPRPLALLRDLAQPVAQLLDALADDLTIALELRLARTARPDTTTEP